MSPIHRIGWQMPVGFIEGDAVSELIKDPEFSYDRVELRGVRLTHAASIFLIQGASLRDLFSDVVIDPGAGLYSVVFSEPPELYVPPPKIARVVLARIVERPVALSPQELLHRLFMREAST